MASKKKEVKNLFAQGGQALQDPLAKALGSIGSIASASQSEESPAQEKSDGTTDPEVQKTLERMKAAEAMYDKVAGPKQEGSALEAAILAAAPALLGRALGGETGALAGVQAGQSGLKGYQDTIAEQEAARKERAKTLLGYSGELEKAAATKSEADLARRKLEADENYRRQQLGLEKEKIDVSKNESLEKLKKERMELEIPGFVLTGQKTPSRKNIEDVTSASESANNILGNLDSLEAKIIEHGTELLPTEAKAEMSALSTDAKLQAKELNKLGVLSGPDLRLMEKLIPDPTTIQSGAIPNESMIAQIKMTKELMARRVREAARVRGYRLEETNQVYSHLPENERINIKGPQVDLIDKAVANQPSPEDMQAIQWAMQNKNDDRAKKILKGFGL